MADNFLQAINTGINLGHMADSARMQRQQMERMAQEIQFRQMDHLMKVAEFQEKLRQREENQNFIKPGERYRVVAPGSNLVDITNPSIPVFTAPSATPAEKEPTVPLFVDKILPDGRAQAMRWNPATKDHDIPFGSPKTESQSASSALAKKPQQSQFTDPESGLPLIFDPVSGSYKVAEVGGSGKVAPRTVNPSAGERTTNAMFDVIRGQLQRIKGSYKSDYVGLISGQAGRATQFQDPNEAGFRQVILDVKDSLLRARSGAQINEQEYKRLAKLVPDFTDSEPQFAGKMKSFETTLDSIAAEREKAQRKGGVYIRQVGPQMQVGPQIGEVKKGYRFMGGNPSDPESWKAVK